MGKRKELSREAVQLLADKVRRVTTLEAVGLPTSTFYRLCDKLEIGYKTDKSSYRVTEEDEVVMAQLSKQNLSHRDIGERFNVSHTSVGRRLRRRSLGKKPRQIFKHKTN